MDYATTTSNGQRAKVKCVDRRILAYKKIIEGALMMCAGIFELATGEKPQKYDYILKQ